MKIPLLLVSQFVLTGLVSAAPSFDDINKALGLNLLADESLWDDSAADVSQRLAWPKESDTGDQASFRNYTKPDVLVAGAHVYSEALYARAEKPESLSLIFANQGDFGDYFKVAESMEVATGSAHASLQRKAREIQRDFPKALAADSAKLAANLTTLFGPPVASRNTMSGDANEKIQAWNWSGHSFLLSTLANGFVALRILPEAAAAGSEKNTTRDAELKAKLAAQLEKRPNGDVVVGHLPMVDQGPKGFCVPATLERYFRYLGIPADMYILALQAQTGMGGGTGESGTYKAANALARANGRRFEKVQGLRLTNLARYIDEGLPVMWGIQARDDIEKDITDRMAQRKATTDPVQWKEILKKTPKSKKSRATSEQSNLGHMCLIIGYNKETGELAISDSWGPQFAERWVTKDEFEALSDNEAAVVSF